MIRQRQTKHSGKAGIVGVQTRGCTPHCNPSVLTAGYMKAVGRLARQSVHYTAFLFAQQQSLQAAGADVGEATATVAVSCSMLRACAWWLCVYRGVPQGGDGGEGGAAPAQVYAAIGQEAAAYPRLRTTTTRGRGREGRSRRSHASAALVGHGDAVRMRRVVQLCKGVRPLGWCRRLTQCAAPDVVHQMVPLHS